jgi:porin
MPFPFMNKRTMPFALCFCLGAIVSTDLLRGAPSELINSSEPQEQPPTQTPNQPTPASTGLPELPTTSDSTVPEGLRNNVNDMWKADYLTGNWGGFRDDLKNAGISLTPTYIGEVLGNPSGGARQGIISDGLFNMGLDLDLDKMTHGALDDMTVHANAFYIYGKSLSASYVGDFSGASNIAAYNTLCLQELWLQKSFWEKRLSIKVGNMAVDNEFFQSSSAALFINGTFGAFTFIANNVPNAPVYPIASPGVRIQLLPTSKFYVMAGVYGMDNKSNPSVNNQNGTRFASASDSGMLVMSEMGYLLNQSPNDHGLQGAYRVGSFVHTANYNTFDSQAQSANGTGPLESAGANYGVYGVMDQQIYQQGAEGISLFVRSGGAPSNTNFVDYYVEGGFNFTGFIPGRDNDVAGIAVARSHVSDQYSDSQVLLGNPPSTAETVIEATYKVQVAPWWTIQPDMQYIVTPSGVEGSQNAFVLGVRTSVAF